MKYASMKYDRVFLKNHSASSPRNTRLSAPADPRMGSDGWNATACTVPRCPGSLYSTFPDDASHTKTFRQLDPAATRAPSGDHASP